VSGLLASLLATTLPIWPGDGGDGMNTGRVSEVSTAPEASEAAPASTAVNKPINAKPTTSLRGLGNPRMSILSEARYTAST
jgi:hypothetical protein